MQCLHMSHPCLRSSVSAFTTSKSSTFKAQYCQTRRVQHLSVRAANQPDAESETSTSGRNSTQSKSLDKEVKKFATTFAPRASGNTGGNPAFKGSTLYTVFEAQAWLGLVVGGFLSFNLLFPSERPDIARLMGMWSIWMFTIPSLRARECNPQEKDALNLLFLLVPLINITLPFIWKSFPVIYSADCIALAGIFFWKGVWKLPQNA